MQRNKLVTEEYLLKEYEKKVADKMRVVCQNLGSKRAVTDAHGKDWIDKDWSRSNHKMWISYNGSRRKYHGPYMSNAILFKNFRYDPDLSKRTYGKPQIIDKTESKPIRGKSFRIDNRGSAEPSHLSINEKITLSQRVEHRMDHHVEMNVTTQTTLKGSYAGVEAEAQFSASFGYAFDDSRTKEETESRESQFTDEYEVPADKYYLVSLVNDSIIEETPYNIEGCFDCDIFLDIDDYAGLDNQGHLHLWNSGRRRGGKDKRLRKSGLEFTSFLDMERFFRGYHVDYPDMKNFMNVCSPGCRKNLEWIFNPANRIVNVSGIKRREFDDNVTISHKEVQE